jgi:hypothetical protein
MFDACLHLHTAERRLDVQEMDQTSHLFFFFFNYWKAYGCSRDGVTCSFFSFFYWKAYGCSRDWVTCSKNKSFVSISRSIWIHKFLILVEIFFLFQSPSNEQLHAKSKFTIIILNLVTNYVEWLHIMLTNHLNPKV